jgi:4'-phosphopantetheinyl transferase EntD
VAPRDGTLQHLGIDLERRPTVAELDRPSIARKILTSREFALLEQFAGDDLAAREHTLVHFAIKEAVYKAIDPFVERYVRFTEVELDLRSGGEARVTLHLPEPSVADVHVAAQWRFEGDWIVAAAYSLR